MTDEPSPAFAISVQSDAYGGAQKIMGRSVAGENFLRGLARTWPNATLQCVATGRFSRERLVETLGDGGFTGDLRFCSLPSFSGAAGPDALYYPTIVTAGLARFRNQVAPTAYSLFGVTHTISTDRAFDALSAMAAAPFMPWDALICTSQAALSVVTDIFDETHDDLRRDLGATRLERPLTPVIPLGVNIDRWSPSPDAKAQARANLGIAADEVVFLFAGRLSFHSKANTAPLYQALQAIAGSARIVCIEAGQFPTETVRQAYLAARTALAPDIRFIHAAGDDAAAYADAWQAADVFTSLSDNVQETFGLTPVEAMAAGLPVVVSDWNGYRSNIRHGVDGFLIPTTAAPPGAGEDLGVAVEASAITYDAQIGLVSLGVAVDQRALAAALRSLATDPALRDRMGGEGRRRAQAAFDWPIVLRAYDALARELSAIRARAAPRPPQAWSQRPDPFRRFAAYPSRTTADDDIVALRPEAASLLQQVAALEMANYMFGALLPRDALGRLVQALDQAGGTMRVGALLGRCGGPTPPLRRALAWLLKFDTVSIGPAG
jgi:glycosyltransferase involved in cell wall biosynthesis